VSVPYGTHVWPKLLTPQVVPRHELRTSTTRHLRSLSGIAGGDDIDLHVVATGNRATRGPAHGSAHIKAMYAPPAREHQTRGLKSGSPLRLL